MTTRERGGSMKNLIHTGGIIFSFLFALTGKVVEELLEFKYKY